MVLIKCRFLKENVPSGREYTYRSGIEVKVGDLVQINYTAKGIVTAVDVSKAEVSAFADKVKTIVGKAEVDMILRNWRVINAVSHEIQPPEMIPKYFKGRVFGNPFFQNGEVHVTSPALEILDYGDHKVIVTVTGSRYEIRPETLLREAEEMFPGYYKRLKMEGEKR